ncbi:hypothetical protein ACUOA5_38350, partial [Escherichia coli]
FSRLLKPATINRRINSIKRYFDWAKQKGLVQTNYSKSIKFLPTEKTSPKRMSDKEESALINAVEKYGTLRDKTMIIFMQYTLPMLNELYYSKELLSVYFASQIEQ